MNETENNQPVTETTPTEAAVSATTETRKIPVIGIIASILVAVVIIFGVLYMLEKGGKSSTSIFSSVIESQQAGAVVAVVNGEDITAGKLNVSIQQYNQIAASQGIDMNDSEAQQGIKTQALDVLINTMLLKQNAIERGIVVPGDAVTERIDAIRNDLGGEEILQERMATLGIGQEQLIADVSDELLIQQLLEQIFSENDLTVSEEEVIAIYEGAGGEEAGLPALEDVRGEVEAQIVASKEQVVIDEYLSVLREEASIEIIQG